MKQYVQVSISGIDEPLAEILIAELSEAGYYAFEQEDQILHAFIEQQDYSETRLNDMLPEKLPFTASVLQEQNWNQQWEQDFKPVVLGDFAAIRATFHEPIESVTHEIIITPKMSFGTGHHATTRMMMSLMQQLDFLNKQVVDFGTGTGVLAILAEKLGAASVLSIDNDTWSIDNAQENLRQNSCTKIEVIQSEDLSCAKKSDVILANINLNVLLSNSKSLADKVNEGGYLLLSGFLQEDQNRIETAFSNVGFVFDTKVNERNWMAMTFIKR